MVDKRENNSMIGIELRSEKVRNIIGLIPSVLIRSGIGIISIVILGVLIGSYFIPYYETTTGDILIYTYPSSEIITSSSDGLLLDIVDVNRQYVKKGEVVASFNPDSTNSIVKIKSSISGRLLSNCKKNEVIKSGEVLFAIVPDSTTKLYGRILFPKQLCGKINKGQEVRIELKGFSSRDLGYIHGYVEKVYPINFKNSDGALVLKVDVSLPNRLTTSYGKEIAFEPQMTGCCKVILSKQRLLRKMLGFVK